MFVQIINRTFSNIENQVRQLIEESRLKILEEIQQMSPINGKSRSNELQSVRCSTSVVTGIEPRQLESNDHEQVTIQHNLVSSTQETIQVSNAVTEKSKCNALDKKQKYYQCESCDFWSYVKYNFNKHLQTKHLNQTFLYTKELQKSPSRGFARITTPENERYHCKSCNYVSSYRYDLEKHARRTHLSNSKSDCEKSFDGSKSKDTMRKVHKIRKSKCPFCEYSTFGNLERHVRVNHSERLEASISCINQE